MASIPHAKRLCLAPHVRACHGDGQVILLDLRRNKYLGVGGKPLAALARVIEGWPACPAQEQTMADTPDVDMLVQPLLSQGVLTAELVDPAPAPHLQEAVESLNAADAMDGARVGATLLWRFLRGASAAAMSLRFSSLLSIAEALAARRARLAGSAEAAPLDRLGKSVAAYEMLRPLVFTARDRCLFDSLALLHFLASEQMVPRWVIGVRTQPFGAHSWLQSGGTVLNDQHEYVRQFHPILVV